MKHISLGTLDVARVGLGAMGMSGSYTGAGTDDAESIRAIHRALELGVTLIDTAEIYGPFTNEELVGQAIKGHRDEVVLATKFGFVSHCGGTPGNLDSSPANIRPALEGSLRRLATDHIDLYYQHRVDPNTPIEDTVGTLAELVAEGKISISGSPRPVPVPSDEPTPCTPSPRCSRNTRCGRVTLRQRCCPYCENSASGFVAYSPLGRGFLTGEIRSTDDFADDDHRKTSPRFMGENFQRNLRTVEEVKGIAAEVGATAAQVALAWALAQGDDIVPIPGTKRVARVEENCAADSLQLSLEQIDKLTNITPAAGDHHNEQHMRMIER
jgi:aryl-alcohol dehydrogenase-like predicted oxidoreductase